MRVIAGSAKGRKLISREGSDTRPTTDRSKEALFAMLQFEVPGTRFLDLFAGSGAIGIEALSRGAESAVFVEVSLKAARCVRENLKVTDFLPKAELLQADVYTAIRSLGEKNQKFDIIFLDPPYDHDFENPVVEAIWNADLLAEDGLIVVESSAATEVVSPHPELTMEKVRDYKLTKFTFLRNERVYADRSVSRQL